MTTDRDDSPALDADERALLARWTAPTPPAGFAERLVPAAPRRRRWPAVAAAMAAVAAVAAVGVAVAGPRRSLAVVGGDVDAAAGRRSAPLASRGVAVLEPGARLAYVAAAGELHVIQAAGSVFYRVEPGRRFTVATSAGTVEVTGTCFRVEVSMRHPMLAGAALGAVVATAAVVTVYEGRVRVVPGHAAPVEVKAGEVATLGPAGGGGAVVAAGPAPVGGAAAPAPVVDDPTVATLSQAQLVARDRAQREQIAALEARVRDLQAPRPGHRGLDVNAVDPSKEELLAWAKECKVVIDFIPMGPRPFELDPALRADVGLSDLDLGAANAALARLRTDWTARVRAWYVEATGDSAGADALSVESMARELQDKAAPGEPAALQRRLAEERAGLVAAPADVSKASPFERYFRAFAAMGDDAERAVAEVIGRERAHQVRVHDGGWPARMSMAGCDEREPAP